jgi:TolA-binding protein
MNHKVKFGLYAVLLISAIIFGVLFYSSYQRVTSEETGTTETVTPETPEPTNSAAATNATETNLTAQTTNSEQVSSATITNSASSTNAATNAVAAEPPPQHQTSSVPVAREPAHGRSTMIGYLGAFLGIAILLGLLLARDLSHFFGGRSVDFLFNDEGTGIKNPEYEEAEQEWANGNHLEAIRMMRDYLTKNPREQYVALRIAEIYEKDLKNNLAAALEYEQVLKHKLPPDRWGWAAIHLCNLYSKLGKTDDAVALLRRIVAEYGETPAAEKARKRLATFENVGEEGLDADLPESIQSAPPPKVRKVEPEPPSSNLPPGFRPKK